MSPTRCGDEGKSLPLGRQRAHQLPVKGKQAGAQQRGQCLKENGKRSKESSNLVEPALLVCSWDDPNLLTLGVRITS